MNRGEFLSKFFKMYPNSFNEDNLEHWTEAYMIVLTVDLDFKRLFYYMIRNYNDTYKAPAPSWFLDFIKLCKIEKHNCLKNEPAYIFHEKGIPEHVQKQMAELKKKLEDKS